MSDILDRIRHFVREYNMIAEKSTVVCGLSGGADSVCLLLTMMELGAQMGFFVEALHVNHCLRGEESDRDEEFCRRLCRELNVSFTAVSCDVRGFAQSHGISCEEAARAMRYDVFRSHSSGKLVATAHNADDCLETMILNLIRGTGLKGLAGIPPVRDNIIRPLMCVSRSEIEEYLRNRGQAYVTDSTNLIADGNTRNKIRHKIIPLMKMINPSLIETSRSTAEILREENSFIERAVGKAYEKSLKNGGLLGISEYDALIRERCVSRYLTSQGCGVSRKRIRECSEIAVRGGKLCITDGVYFVSDGEFSRLERQEKKKGEEILSAELKIGENRIFSNCVLICEVEGKEYINKNLTSYLIDYDKIKGRAFVRNRRYGDKIKLPHRNFTSSIKKLINEKVPKEMRSTLHFIEDGEGTVFAEMIGVAQRVAPDENTSRLLVVTVLRNGG